MREGDVAPHHMNTRVMTLAKVRPAGYHNMCRWNFMGMMQHPKVRGLDYYCRIDTDSRIKSKVLRAPNPNPDPQCPAGSA